MTFRRRKYRLPLTLGDLTIRRLNRGDADDVLAYRSDPVVSRQQYWEPFTEEKVYSLIASQALV
jgi:hypothetical protein